MISKKAASEIVVRQALAELDQWDVQARFILNPHKNSRGKDILLVKDFKEVLNKVSSFYLYFYRRILEICSPIINKREVK